VRGTGRLALGLTHDGRPVRSLTSAVLAHVRAEVLSCRLKPGGKLLIAGLATRFGVSLSAVREALARLAAEGLVKAEDQRGFRVSPVSIEDLRDITRTRIALEGLAHLPERCSSAAHASAAARSRSELIEATAWTPRRANSASSPR